MAAVASLVSAEMPFAWWQRTRWAGVCLQARHAEVKGSVFASQLLLGNRHPPAELSERRPRRRGGRVARSQTAAWDTEVAMAALCRYTLHKKAVMLGHTDSFFALHRRLAPTLGTEEQNKYWNIISVYTYVLKSIVRLHLTVELGLKHLGNDLHIVSTTSLPLPPFPLAAQNKPTPWHPSQQNGSLLRLSVFMKLI